MNGIKLYQLYKNQVYRYRGGGEEGLRAVVCYNTRYTEQYYCCTLALLVEYFLSVRFCHTGRDNTWEFVRWKYQNRVFDENKNMASFVLKMV